MCTQKTVFSKTPSVGLGIYNLASCNVSSLDLSDSGWNGIQVLETKECFMEDVHVKNCTLSGIYFRDTAKGEMLNCSVRNCKRYGVYVLNNEIIGENVQFVGNKMGETYGNFIKK
eukprot:TRINITY_DN18334_c2_g2_i2.p2 TRINITY_DN18334_c2_g2~~TRINITY_DN18334_c2_g2_i2.p2  ORF type:complete len:115 (+),score=10.58 TRINITY_DN18334_c2_g2_i2:154-498(+)